MKRTSFAITLLLVMLLMLCSISVFAYTYDDSVLTLEEAKALALKNNVHYSMQQIYIDQAKENYQDVLNDSAGNSAGKKNVAAKASAEISEDVAIENAASAVRKAVFNRDDMKRTSDYSVTEAFYDVIKAKYSLATAESEMELKKKDLETAKIKYGLSIITLNSLTQAESSYATSQVNYNEALSELEISILQLSKSIGKDLNVSNCKLDTAISVPDIKSLDLNKIKEDYLKNNSSYFSAREQYKLAEYKLLATHQQYDDYYEKIKNSTESVRDDFEDMLYEAQRDFSDAEYSYNKKLSDLDTSINNQYSSILSLYENYENQKKEFEDARVTVEENTIKYHMGLISITSLESSEASLDKLESQLNSTIMSFNLQYLNLIQYSQK